MPERRLAGVRQELALVGYSAGNFGKNLLNSGIDVTLLFLLTDLIGIAPGSVSALMAMVLLGNLVFDVAAGYIATEARKRGIGYRTIIALAAMPCGIAFALLYALPALGIREVSVIALTLLVFRLAMAFVDVPHNSLLARIAHDSHSRGRASGYRLFFSALSSLAVAAVLAPAVIDAARRAMPDAMATLGIGSAILSCIVLWIAAWSSRGEKMDARQPAHGRTAFFPRPDGLFAGAAAIALVTGFAAPMFSRMIIYLATYVYERPALAEPFLLAFTLGQFPGFALWTWLVRHGEKTIWLAISSGFAAVAMALAAVLDPPPGLMIAMIAVIGMGLSGVFMLPWGILADVIDFAEYRHRERREAATVATFLVLLKASGAVSVGFIGWALGGLGYVAGAHQAPQVLIGMRLLAFGVPSAGCLISILVVTRMSIGHRAHARVVRILDARGTVKRRGLFDAAPPEPPDKAVSGLAD